MALKLTEIEVEIREISLREKPAHLLQASPKGTVPVLILLDGTVIDESLEIMFWAFNQLSNHTRAENGALQSSIYKAFRASPERALIETNDTSFKEHLDCYKYPERNSQHKHEKTQLEYRQQGEVFLQQLEELLQQNTYLFGAKFGLVDLAIFPFIRQFSAVDAAWFAQCQFSKLRAWLNGWIESDLFKSIMTKARLL